MKNSTDIKLVILLHRLLRWGFGVLFTTIGIVYYNEGAWAAILFGGIFLVTGFFRPKRCLQEDCKVTPK